MKGRLLKGIGLALVAAPEPFTTPVGVGLLAASWLISRAEEARKRAHLRRILTGYLHTYRPLGYGASLGAAPAVQHHVWEPRPASQPRRRVSLQDAIYVRPSAQQPGGSHEVVHHTLDWGRVLRRVDAGGTRRGFEGIWGAETRVDVKVVHHTIRKDLAVTMVKN